MDVDAAKAVAATQITTMMLILIRAVNTPAGTPITIMPSVRTVMARVGKRERKDTGDAQWEAAVDGSKS